MQDSQVSGRKLSKWLEDFLGVLNKNKTANLKEVEADINVLDLPKVVWNDETYYVLFDTNNNTAKLYNRFSNEVDTLENVSTLDEVEKLLNSKQVVTGEFDSELEKVIADFDDTTNTDQVLESTEPTNSTDSVSPEVNDVNTQTNSTTDNTTTSSEDMNSEMDKIGSTLEYIKRISSLEEQVLSLTQTVEELKGQLYARQDPGNVYDTNVMVEEVKHFQETSKQTADQINQDNKIDITTMNGRISLVDRLRQDLAPILEEQPIELEFPVSVDESINPNINNVPSENKEILEENPEEILPEIEETPTDDKLNENVEDDQLEKNKNEENTDDKPGVISLGTKDSKIFKNAICPHCGESSLLRTAAVKSFVGVYCKDCNTEYAVNLLNEEIYQKV